MDFINIINKFNLCSQDEYSSLQWSTVEQKESLGEILFKLKDDRRLRKEAYKKMKEMVESSLKDGEEMKFGAILLQSNMRERIDGITVGACGGEITYYLGIFYTNKSFYIFEMNFKYKQLSDMCVCSLSSIKRIEEKWDIKTIVIEFSDGRRVLIRANGENEEMLIINMVKYFNEKGIDIKPYHEPIRKGWIAAGTLTAVIVVLGLAAALLHWH